MFGRLTVALGSDLDSRDDDLAHAHSSHGLIDYSPLAGVGSARASEQSVVGVAVQIFNGIKVMLSTINDVRNHAVQVLMQA